MKLIDKRSRCIHCDRYTVNVYYWRNYEDIMECAHCGAMWLYGWERTWERWEDVPR